MNFLMGKGIVFAFPVCCNNPNTLLHELRLWGKKPFLWYLCPLGWAVMPENKLANTFFQFQVMEKLYLHVNLSTEVGN